MITTHLFCTFANDILHLNCTFAFPEMPETPIFYGNASKLTVTLKVSDPFRCASENKRFSLVFFVFRRFSGEIVVFHFVTIRVRQFPHPQRFDFSGLCGFQGLRKKTSSYIGLLNPVPLRQQTSHVILDHPNAVGVLNSLVLPIHNGVL